MMMIKLLKKRPFDTTPTVFTQGERIRDPFVVSAHKVRVSNHVLLIILISLLSYVFASASPGCMDNSWHLERPFDNKEYHIVGRKIGKQETFCPCPCRKLSLSRGQCLECGHKHEMQPWIIVRTPNLR